MKKITREEIQNKLLDWQKGLIGSKQLHEWAGKLCADDGVEFADQEGDDSIAGEVLFLLDVMDMNLSTAEDAPLYLRLLSTPAGAFDTGMKDFDKKFKARALDQRRHRLKSDSFYSKFIE